MATTPAAKNSSSTGATAKYFDAVDKRAGKTQRLDEMPSSPVLVGGEILKAKAKVVKAMEVNKADEIAKSKAKMGRPSSFTQEIADKICEELASGYSLRTVCKPDEMPSIATVFNWFRSYPDFLEQYTRAKQESADAMAEEVIDIADDATNDWMDINADGEGAERYSLNGEHVQRSRLRIETRKWLMAKMKPKKYGDKLDVTSDGKAMPAPIISIVGQNAIEENNS